MTNPLPTGEPTRRPKLLTHEEVEAAMNEALDADPTDLPAPAAAAGASDEPASDYIIGALGCAARPQYIGVPSHAEQLTLSKRTLRQVIARLAAAEAERDAAVRERDGLREALSAIYGTVTTMFWEHDENGEVFSMTLDALRKDAERADAVLRAAPAGTEGSTPAAGGTGGDDDGSEKGATTDAE